MASRFTNPFPQYLDATPAVRAGARLFFYAAGTATKLNTYSDRTLSSANTNPVVLNSAGYPSVDIYLQDLDYKVVLAPSTDSDPPVAPIWTADYVQGRDSKLIAKTITGSGTPTGTVAGTQGSSSILPDFYWDYTNSILYVCTTTGTTLTAVWTAVNASAATPSFPIPQGRLTLTSAVPILAADVASATAVYYTPFSGNLIPIYNGASMAPTEFAELTLTLAASHALNTLYDVFVYSNAGVLTVVTGPAWTTSTAGAGARGTGAGTTQLTRVKGLYVNAVQMTARNGATTYTVGANLGTYVGTIQIDGTAGQVTCTITYGQSRIWGVWNAYNRQPIMMQVGDATASWTHAGGSVSASNSNTANSCKTVVGLPEEIVYISGAQRINSDGTTASSDFYYCGVGVNSSSATSGLTGRLVVASGTQTVGITAPFANIFVPGIGTNAFTMLERSANATTGTFFGTIANMLMTATYRG